MNVLHDGGTRAVAGPLHQAADFPGRSLENRLDAAVRKVPHPAAHTVLLGHPAARIAEEHALHATRDQDPIANHKDTVRPRSRRRRSGIERKASLTRAFH